MSCRAGVVHVFALFENVFTSLLDIHHSGYQAGQRPEGSLVSGLETLETTAPVELAPGALAEVAPVISS